MTLTGVSDYLSLGLQLSVGFVLALSAWTKVRHPYRFADSVKAYALLPRVMTRPAAALVILLEVLITVALLTSSVLALALPGAVFLFAIFLGAVRINLQRRRAVACGCFGDSEELISPRTAARLALLVAVVGALWLRAAAEHGATSNVATHPLAVIGTPVGILVVFWSFTFLMIGRWLLAWTETGQALQRIWHW